MIATVGDLRRALEGVSDDTPLGLTYLDDDCLMMNMPVGEAGLMLNHDGTGSVFVLESDDLITFAQMHTDLLKRMQIAEPL